MLCTVADTQGGKGLPHLRLWLPGWEAELLVTHSQAELGNERKLRVLSWFPSSAWGPMVWKLLLPCCHESADEAPKRDGVCNRVTYFLWVRPCLPNSKTLRTGLQIPSGLWA